MDLHTVTSVVRPRRRADLPAWRPGDAWLAGGTWLMSEPQPGTRRLIDLDALAWPAIRIDETGLDLAATCTFATLVALEVPADWAAAALIQPCCRALVGSFKVWNTATVGGNVCLALPAAPLVALLVALDAVATVWTPGGGERREAVETLVTGPGETSLAPGELVRSCTVRAASLARRATMRRASLSAEGRSAALLIGTRGCDGDVDLTVTAATRRPVKLRWPALPDGPELEASLRAALPEALWFVDLHGTLAWRQAMTFRLAREIRAELADLGP